jgi:Fe2+ or Zn2+ uptake regulation protein
MKSKNPYLHFLNLTERLAQELMPQIDLQSKKILETISWHHQLGNALTVTQVMQLDTIASAATIHRKLDDLRESGLIQNTHQGNNRRTKFLTPTKLSLRYFEKVGKLMLKTTRSNGLD